jgi:hypothetical protein
MNPTVGADERELFLGKLLARRPVGISGWVRTDLRVEVCGSGHPLLDVFPTVAVAGELLDERLRTVSDRLATAQNQIEVRLRP